MFNHEDLMDITKAIVPLYRGLPLDTPAILVPHDQPHIELMQYIGEEDCNGREIWENDVYSDDMGYLYQVIFQKGSFVLLSIPDPFNHRSMSPLANIPDSELKYEGNVYENPKLLELRLGCSCSEKDCEHCVSYFADSE